MEKERVVLFLLLSIVLTGVSSVSVNDSNTYMDAVIKDYLKNDLKDVDPTDLPSFYTSFQTSHSVTANFTRGALSGLTSVKRFADCKVPYTRDGNSTLNCTLSFDQLNVKYDLSGTYGTVLPTVKDALAEGFIRDTQIFVEVTTSPNKNLPSLKGFSVNYLGDFKSDFSRLGSLFFPRHTLGNVFASNSSVLVVAVLNNQFKQKVSESVTKLTMPIA